jgi:hypothetical protein
MKKADLTIGYYFWILCPFCGKNIDLSDGDYDSDGEFSDPIFNNRWDSLKGKHINCIHCLSDFKIGEIKQ